MTAATDIPLRDQIAHLAATCVCNNLRRTTRAVTAYYDALLQEQSGVRITQIPLLVCLYLAGPQTINEMAERLDIDRTTLTRNVKPLAQAGMVNVEPGTDQRTRVVRLLPAGEAALLQGVPLWEQAQAHMLHSIGGIGADNMGAWLAQLADLTALAQEP